MSDALGAAHLLRSGRIMLNILRGDKLFYQAHVSLAPYFFGPPAGDGLVLFCGHRAFLLSRTLPHWSYAANVTSLQGCGYYFRAFATADFRKTCSTHSGE